MKNAGIRVYVICVIMVFLAAVVHAEDLHWLNRSSNFNDKENWSGGSVPGENDRAFFSSAVSVQPHMTDARWVYGIYFTPERETPSSEATSACGGYVLTGNPGAVLTLATSGYNHSGVYAFEQCTTGTNKIMVPISFPVAGPNTMRAFSVVAGTLELAGPVYGSSSNIIRFIGPSGGEVILSGNFSGFSGGLIRSSATPIFVRNSASIATLTILGFEAHGSGAASQCRLVNETGGPLVFAGNPELRLGGGDGFVIESDYPVDFGDGGVVLNDADPDRNCPLTINAPWVRIGGSAHQEVASHGYFVKGTGTLEVCSASDYTGNTRVQNAIFLARDPEAFSPLSAIVLSSSSSSIPGGVLGLGYGDFTNAVGTGAGCFCSGENANGGWAAYGEDRNVNVGGDMRQLTNATPFFQRIVLGAYSADATVTFQNPLAIVNDIVFYAIKGSADIAGRITGVLTSPVSTKTVEKRGNGVLELTANSPLSGTFNIYDGRLLLSGSLDTTMNVKAGGCLAGGGTLSKVLTVEDGGMLAMDNRLGSLTVSNNVTFNAGALMEVTLDGTDVAGVVCLGSSKALKNEGTVGVVIQTAHKNVGRGTMPILDWSGADSPGVTGLDPSRFEVVNTDEFSATFAIEGKKLVMEYHNLNLRATVIMLR